MNRRRIHVPKVKFSVVQHVRISQEKTKFAKGGEQNFSTEVFRITKFKDRRPRPVYEVEDLNKSPKERQFYAKKLTPVRISKDTTYKIDKILVKRFRRCFREDLVRWKGYSKDFNSWIPAYSMKDI